MIQSGGLAVAVTGLIWLVTDQNKVGRVGPDFLQKPTELKLNISNNQQTESFKEITVKNGDNFELLLVYLGFMRTDALKLIEEMRSVFNPRKMQVGQVARYYPKDNGAFHFEYEIDYLKTLVAVKAESGLLRIRLDIREIESRLHVIRGRISYSLFDAIASLGERDDLADRLASLFEYDVDFNRDLRRDDRFALLVEKRFVKKQFIGYGRIHAAYLRNADREFTLGWFSPSGQEEGYFHPEGDAVERFFLKCPLPFMRLTSGFGNRHHPVLGFSARHFGIDLGAPVGTVVRSTASGRIRRLGRDSVRGLFVEAAHPNGYETHYYHLKSLAGGIRGGAGVKQGQVIAYVGNSGRSTGPHLHYGIKKAGRFINPLSLKTPPKRKLPANELEPFQNRLSLYTLVLSLGDPFLQFYLDSERWFMSNATWLASANDAEPM